MVFIQSKGKVTQSIALFDEYFNFSYSDPRAFDTIDINYTDIAPQPTEQVEENEWLRIVGFAWMAIGLFQLLFALYSGYSTSGKGFWILVGGLCVFWSYASVVKYTVIKTEHGNICIIHDDKHDKIISELQAKRSEYRNSLPGSGSFTLFSGRYCCLKSRKEFSGEHSFSVSPVNASTHSLSQPALFSSQTDPERQ